MTPRIIMPQQVTRFAAPGELLKRPRELRTRRQPIRSGRETDSGYLDLIRQLPCCCCGLEGFSEAAHVRMNNAALGKHQALGQKPDDRWSTPLCADCHRNDPDSQHKVGEQEFWRRVGIYPLALCEALHKAAPDLLKMRAVVFRFIETREPAL